eukprot:3791634-Lingulodinium_polyedra.AAC.1
MPALKPQTAFTGTSANSSTRHSQAKPIIHKQGQSFTCGKQQHQSFAATLLASQLWAPRQPALTHSMS